MYHKIDSKWIRLNQIQYFYFLFVTPFYWWKKENGFFFFFGWFAVFAKRNFRQGGDLLGNWFNFFLGSDRVLIVSYFIINFPFVLAKCGFKLVIFTYIWYLESISGSGTENYKKEGLSKNNWDFKQATNLARIVIRTDCISFGWLGVSWVLRVLRAMKDERKRKHQESLPVVLWFWICSGDHGKALSHF